MNMMTGSIDIQWINSALFVSIIIFSISSVLIVIK
ncbi:Uncharacterised protein [Klebsiella pneumoniae]|nr:Uncharacterised protein [Klebsiella pneumoniae]